MSTGIDALDKLIMEKFPSLCTRTPGYRYFNIGNREFCWTTEPGKSAKHTGRMRFASFQVKNGRILKTTFREHVKRKDAKARAVAMYRKAKGVN